MKGRMRLALLVSRSRFAQIDERAAASKTAVSIETLG
jgi:hypothetical protein